MRRIVGILREDVARSRLAQQADLEQLERECVDSYLAQWFLQGGQAEFGEIEKAFATDADGFMGEVLRLVRALSRPARDRIEQAEADRAAAQQEIEYLQGKLTEAFDDAVLNLVPKVQLEAAQQEIARLRARCDALLDSWYRTAEEEGSDPEGSVRTARMYQRFADELRMALGEATGAPPTDPIQP